jgi:subtilisin family serine protease
VCSAGLTLVLVGFLIAVGGVGGVVGADGGQATVSPVVADATGEQVVVVEVESDWTAESTPTTVEQLEQRATRSQAPLRQYAERTPGVTVERSLWLGNLAVVTIDHGRTDVTDLAGITNVVHVGPNFEVSVDHAGGDPDTAGAVGSLPGQTPSRPPVTGRNRGPTATNTTYGLDQISATEVWSAYGTRGEGVSVAVLDTGVDADHPDLSVEKWQEFDDTGSPVNSQPNDGDGHGTHVSGTVTGAENPAGGVPSFGVAPGAALYGVKVLDDNGRGSFAQIIAGMQWAVDNDADIISMSLGADGFYDQFIDPVRNANTAGTLVVASAGNNGAGSSGSPGNVYDSIAVGASNSNQGIAGFSSGETVDTAADWSSPPADWPSQYVVPDIAAPGVNVLSSVPGGGYDDTYSGTSMAAPHVSGAAALLQSATARNLSVERIETLLVDTATKPDGAPTDPDTRYGNGIIDAKAAVDLATRANELLNVTAEVENTGDAGDTQTIDLSVGALGSDSTGVTLAGGASTNVTLGVGTAAGDAGEYTATVSSEDDSTTTNVTVLEPAELTVSIVETNTPVEGETLNVTARIKNTGDIEDTQTIDLDLGALGTDSTSVTLGGGASTNLTLSVGTGAGDAGEYTATVASSDDTASVNVSVLAQSGFQVNIIETNTPVEGEPLNVTATIENTGDIEDTQTINLSVGALGSDSTTVTLGGGASTNPTLSVGTGAGDAGAYTVTVASEDDTAGANVTINEPSSFDVTITSVDAAVTEGETITVAYEVTNTGDVADTQDIEFAINGTTEDTASSVTLNGSETFSGQFTYDTVAGDAPAVSVTVSSEDDSATKTLTVNEPANLDVTLTSVDPAVTEGETVTVAYEVTNTGDVTDTQDITFAVNGTTEDTETGVTLNGSETFSGQFTYQTVAGDTPAVTVAVSSADDSASETVTVNNPASFDVTITSVDSAVTEGETITVAYEVTNVGDVQDAQNR